MATTWEVWDNSAEVGLTPIASSVEDAMLKVGDQAICERIKAGYDR
jgi:hypothetical protein